MYYKQIFMNEIGSLSYLIGCTENHVACVINPQKNISAYVDAAIKHRLKITHIFETFGHIKQLSGKNELKSITGADIYYLDEHDDKFRKDTVRVGDEFDFGNAKMTIIDSPAHTPFANSIIVTDNSDRSEPWIIPTRESLFMGDIANSDVHGKELSKKVTDYVNFYEAQDQPWSISDMTMNENFRHHGIDPDSLPIM